MGIILGFGSQEKEFEKQQHDFVHHFIVEESKKSTDFGFTKELVQKLTALLEKKEEPYDRANHCNKTAEHPPERYATFHFSIIYSWETLCVAFRFIHINRRHPLSPDGWASLQTKSYFCADVWDYRE